MEKMMGKFKEGDKVKRTGVDWEYGGIYKGHVYTVIRQEGAGEFSRLYLEEIKAPAQSADARAFELYITAEEVAVKERAKQMILTTDPIERKAMPITSGVLGYFPLAIAEVAKVSKAGNDQHNPGQPLHWARGKSTDHHDCIARHLIDKGTFDTDGMRHSAKLAWRALAALQVELEQEKGLFLDAV